MNTPRPHFFTTATAVFLLVNSPFCRAATPTAEDNAKEIAGLKAQNAKQAELLTQMQTTLNTQGAEIKRLEATTAKASAPAKSTTTKQAAGGNSGGTTAANETPPATKDMSLKDMSDSFAAPQTPAAAVLGISGDNVQHVSTPKQLIPTVLNGLDDRGHFQSGFAIDYAPFQHYWTADPNKSDHGKTSADFTDGSLDSTLRRIAVRTQVSFATIKGTTDADKSTKFALGIHSVLFAGNDPLLNGGITPEQQYEPKKLHLIEWLQDDRATRPDNFLQALRRHSNFSVGGAPSWTSNGESSNYTYNGTTAWATYVYTPGPQGPKAHDGNTPFQFIASAVYHNGQKVPGTDAIDKVTATAPISQDSLFLVGGFEFGTYTTRIRATGAFLDAEQSKHGHDQAWRYGATWEQFLTDNTWLSVSVEKESGHSNGRNPTIVLTGIKYAFGANDFTAADKKGKENAKSP